MIRICPNCGAEVPPGDVFCPVCAEEIQLVPDYDSLSNRIREREMQEQEAERKRAEALQRARREEERRRARRRRKILTAAICIIVILAVVFLLAYRYLSNRNSEFENLYQKARTEYQAQNYEIAYEVIEEALLQDPRSQAAQLLKAQILRSLGDYPAAEETLLEMIRQKPSAKDGYRELLDLYMSQGEFTRIRDLMASVTDASVRMAFAEYICTDPLFSISPGDYNRELDVSISSEKDTVIYYTADGSDPLTNGIMYSNTIHLINGETVLRAVAVKPNGIMSGISEGTYRVKTSGLNPPEVMPVSGNYQGTEPEKIIVNVPVGCVCYYSFDTRADKNSLVYAEPVDMPAGSHIFYCFIVDGSGDVSQQTIRTYVFKKLAPTPTPTPSPTPTPVPTATPTPEPTAEPTTEPTPEPTSSPEPTETPPETPSGAGE